MVNYSDDSVVEAEWVDMTSCHQETGGRASDVPPTYMCD